MYAGPIVSTRGVRGAGDWWLWALVVIVLERPALVRLVQNRNRIPLKIEFGTPKIVGFLLVSV